MKHISILVPTRNRLSFIPQLIRNIENQDYPKKLIEVIIADDSDTPINHLLPAKYRYLRYDMPITIAEKRHDLNKHATGQILICMDDDDYYPPTRIKHAVEVLTSTNHQFACCPTYFLYYPKLKSIYRTGPWLTNWSHNSFAYTKQFAESHHYNKKDKYSEERVFTNFYRIPYAILKPKLTILSIAHGHNTIPKNDLGKRLLTNLILENFIKDMGSLIFYQQLRIKSGGPIKL